MFRDLARRTTTAAGLRVFARSLRGVYEKSERTLAHDIGQLRFLVEHSFPNWNDFVLSELLREVISSSFLAHFIDRS